MNILIRNNNALFSFISILKFNNHNILTYTGLPLSSVLSRSCLLIQFNSTLPNKESNEIDDLTSNSSTRSADSIIVDNVFYKGKDQFAKLKNVVLTKKVKDNDHEEDFSVSSTNYYLV